ncbi:MAG: YjbH domain-containing protein [Gammaproteobacteria bacterium]|nr:YjbH domain-containing protein [Gammaproteobacteria bacterium]
MSHHLARATRGLVLLPWVVAAGALTWPAGPSLADAEPAPITSLFSTPLAPPRPSQGDFGGAGLMQTPIARMPAVGELTASYRDNDQYRLWSASLQLYPWLQATLRYADIRTRLYSPFPGFSGDQTLKDKGLDVQLRLLEEGRWLPELAVGLRDFGGTGLFQGEYLAASKRLGFVDFHLGLGFGYLGKHDDLRNPFCRIDSRFCERDSGTSGRGGKFEYDKWFRGPTAVFGGAEIATPLRGLSLQLEYDPNDYVRDPARVDFDVQSRWNFGAVYRVGEIADLSLGWQRGNTLTFGVTMRTDFGRPSQVVRQPPPREFVDYPPPQTDQIRVNRAINDVFWETGMAVTGLRVEQPGPGDDGATLVITGQHIDLRDPEEAAERVARVLATTMPPGVTRYRIVENYRRIPLVSTDVDAAMLREAMHYPLDGPVVADALRRGEPPDDTGEWQFRAGKGRFVPSITPVFYQSFGGPEAFYMYQLGVFAGGGMLLADGVVLSGYLGITLLDNYDKFNFTVDAFDLPLPRVRTFVREYITGTDVRVENLQLSWFDRLGGPWYAQAYAGYLEMMFGGVGAEVMYRPVDSWWAFGVDVNRVRQRDFDNRFGFRDYQVTTGHASLYLTPPWPQDAMLRLSAGQYLAGDRGVTVEFARRFESGVVAGAYAMFTNVSSEDFGEGSFNKGLYISIPLDLLSNRATRGRGNLPWLPLTRDGGQELMRRDQLFYMTEDRSPFRR